ncbi:MAG: hypothetical protein AAGJ37_00450 [Pseudomonadota bacterium]
MTNGPPISTDFDTARDRLAHAKYQQEAFDLRQDEIRVETGQINPENTSRILRMNRDDANSQEAKARKARDIQAFISLLDEMRIQLNDLLAQMETLNQSLQEKYGQDNVIDGMAQAFLPAEVLAGLETDEDKLNALANEFLNPDGTIKEKYKHLDEAKYVQAWQQAQQLKATLDKYEHKDNLTLEDKQEICNAAEAANVSGVNATLAKTANDEVQHELASVNDAERGGSGEVQTKSALVFGN